VGTALSLTRLGYENKGHWIWTGSDEIPFHSAVQYSPIQHGSRDTTHSPLRFISYICYVTVMIDMPRMHCTLQGRLLTLRPLLTPAETRVCQKES
jgi:hypothetical protein